MYFAAIRMWRHSQQHGLIDATGSQIDEWADIDGVHLSFASGRLITLIVKKEDSCSSIYRIHGNEESITKLLSLRGTRSESGKLGAQVRWADKEEKSGIKSENGKLGADARWNNAETNGKPQKNAKTNGKQMANAIEKMANDGKQSKRVSKDRICNSYSPEFPGSNVPTNFPQNDFGGSAAVTPPNSVPFPALAIVPAPAKLTAKAEMQARYRATPSEMEIVWNELKTLRIAAYGAKEVRAIRTKKNDEKLAEMIDALGVDMALKVVRYYVAKPKGSYLGISHGPRYLFEDYDDLVDEMIIDETIGNIGEERAHIMKNRTARRGRV